MGTLSNSDAAMKNAAEEEMPRVQKVVDASIRQPSKIRQFGKSLLAEDTTNLGGRLIQDLLIPNTKAIILNAVEMILYGGTGTFYRNGYSRPGNLYGSGPDYNRISTSRNQISARPTPEPRSILSFNTDDIEFDFRAQADEVLTQMQEVIDQYNWVRVADFYEFSGFSSPNGSSDFAYGWNNISDAVISSRYNAQERRYKFYIKFPKAYPRRK